MINSWKVRLTGDVRIGSGFEGAKAVTNDENTGTKATKTMALNSSNGEKRSET
jgi:hypothetical protein